MKRKILIGIFSILLIILLAAGYYNNMRTQTTTVNVASGDLKELTTKEKLDDFEYMYNILKDNFPYFDVKKRTLGYDWLSNKKQFEKLIKDTRNNEDFYAALNKIVMQVQNGHTNIISPEMFEGFKETYNNCGYGAWMDIVNNKDVNLKYSYWKGVGTGSVDQIAPIVFKYVEGQYIAVDDDSMDYNLGKFNIPEFSVLESINGKTPEEYIKSSMDKRLLKYDFKRKKVKLNTLFIYKEGKETNLVLKTPEGKKIEKEIAVFQYIPKNYGMKDYNEEYQGKILKDNKIAYLKVPSFGGSLVKQDREGIHDFLNSIKDYPYLIIDIRGNGGGSDLYWSKNIVKPLINKSLSVKNYLVFRDGKYIVPFIETHGMPFIKDITVKPTVDAPPDFKCPPELRKELWWYQDFSKTLVPENPVGFKGKIYLLVDENVFSSSESFAVFAKASNWATLVGTTTGGDGIGMDPCIMALPNSGLIVRFPLDMGINPDGTINEETHTYPDIYVEESVKDYKNYVNWDKEHKDNVINPYDTVLNSILKGIK